MTGQEFANALLKKLDDGYHNREDYPPFAIDSMTDRNRYRYYVRTVAAEFYQENESKL